MFSKSLQARLLLVFSVCLIGVTSTAGDEVDVYFITGQSNAINFAKEADTGSTSFDFSLHFARTADLFNDFPNHTAVANSFSSSNLDASLATSILASGLQQDDRDVALFSFARNGAGLHLNTGPDGNPWIWYPGNDPAAGELYNESLYANFVSWNQARLTELIQNGHTPTVKGLFWFQGEKDGRLGDHELYEENFDNLVDRFRQDYGDDLPIVTTQIREVTDTAANRAVINATLDQAADEDSLMDYITTSDLQFRSSTDVHLTGSGHAALAPRWSEAMLSLQAPTPGDGDFDGDGNWDIDDVNDLLALGPIAPGVTVDAENEGFDLTGDNVIDQNDLSEWLDIAATENGLGSPYRPGDANLDSVVDGSDFNIWNQNKFTQSLQWNHADFNGDGAVDGSDFNIWNSNKFTASDVASVPEPMIPFHMLALVLLVVRRRSVRCCSE